MGLKTLSQKDLRAGPQMKKHVCHAKVLPRTFHREKTVRTSCNLVREPGKNFTPGIRGMQNHRKDGRAELTTFGFVIMPPYPRSIGNCCCILKLTYSEWSLAL